MIGKAFTKSFLILANIFKSIGDHEDDKVLQNLMKRRDIIAKGDITKLVGNFVVTPFIFVDESLKYMDPNDYKKLVQTEVKLFIGFLATAYRTLIELYGYRVADTVALLNTRNVGIDELERLRSLIAEESLTTDFVTDVVKEEGTLTIAQEAKYMRSLVREPLDYHMSNAEFNKLKDTKAFINTVDLQFNIYNSITLPNGKKDVKQMTISVPLIVYPNIKFINAENFINNMLENDHDKKFLSRFWDWRAGAISLADLILASDLVEKYRKRKLSNESDIANYLNKVDKVTMVKDLINGTNSFAKNYNIYIFNQDKQALIESNIRGSLLKDRYKDKVLDKFMGFDLTFVDLEKEQVTVFIKSIPGFSILNFKMLEKGKESDVEKVVKEFLKNNQPF